MEKLQKANRISRQYRSILIASIRNKKQLPPYLETFAQRILAIDTLIIDLKYGIKK